MENCAGCGVEWVEGEGGCYIGIRDCVSKTNSTDKVYKIILRANIIIGKINIYDLPHCIYKWRWCGIVYNIEDIAKMNV